jgi:8-oxo-dGTP pyrophosphatase MutT (NUDIX family)
MQDEGKEVKLASLQYPHAITYVKRYSIKHIFRSGAIVWVKQGGKDYYLVFRSFTRPNRGVQIPGGRLERFENPAQAAVREIKEETGLDVNILCPMGFTYFEDPQRSSSNLQFYYIVQPKAKIDVTKPWLFTDKDKTKQKLECWFVSVDEPTDYLNVGHDKIVEMFKDWLEEHKPSASKKG